VQREREEMIYRQWRALGTSIMAALIRAGDAARERGEG
jgi:hypothetical protein